MSTTSSRGHFNDAAQTAAVRASILGREEEVTRLIWWHLIYWHVPASERAEYAQRCWLRILERARPWDEAKGALITWVRWLVMAEVTHGRRRLMLEMAHAAPRVRDRDESIEPMHRRGAVGKAHDPRPSAEAAVCSAEARALVREMMRSQDVERVGSKAWIAWHYDGEGLSGTDVAALLARETNGQRSISKTRLRQIVQEARGQLAAWMMSHRLTLAPEDCHDSLA